MPRALQLAPRRQSKTPLLSEFANRRSLEQMSQAIEILSLSLVERPKEATDENNGGTGNTAKSVIGHSNQADIELGLRTDLGALSKTKIGLQWTATVLEQSMRIAETGDPKQERSNLLGIKIHSLNIRTIPQVFKKNIH